MNIRLSIIIPFFNEEKTLIQLIEKILNNQELNKQDIQFILVNDGSNDQSKKIFIDSKYHADDRFVFIDFPINRGKGAAIRAAIRQSTGKFTIIQDADLEYDPADIVKMLETAQKQNLQVLYGSRNLNAKNKKGGFSFYWGGRLLTFLTNILYKTKITDEATCYKLFDTQLLKSLPLACNRFEFCPEVTALVALKGYDIKEIAINYFPRDKQEGKKINWRDGIEAIWELLKHKILPNKNSAIFTLISAFVFGVYLLTWSGFFMGYEKETADAALNLLSGKYEIRRAGIGAVLMYLPFATIVKSFDSEKIYRFLSLVPIIYSALTAGFWFLIADQIQKNKVVSIFWAIVVALGSLAWPYSKIGMEYQMTFLISIIFYLLLLWKNQGSSLLYAGIVLGFLAVSKSYGILIFLPTIFFVILTNRSRNNKILDVKKLLYITLPIAFAILYTLLSNYLKYHHFSGAYTIAKEFQIWSWWEGFYGIFFSFGRSIFIYSPLLILSLFYWPKFYREKKEEASFILLSFLTIFLITAPFSFWTDETLSVRKLVPIIGLLHLPLVLLTVKNKLIKLLSIAFVGLSFYTQIIDCSYAYWEQLVITRPANLDYFSSLRYNPFVSHIYLNNYLFSSYLKSKFTGINQRFVYSEKSWMRCCNAPATIDIPLISIDADISQMMRPNIFIIRSLSKTNKIGVLSFSLLTILISGVPLTAYFIQNSKIKKSLV